MKLKALYERLLVEIDIPDKLYHVSPYIDEIESYGKLKPAGMGAGDDFGKGFGGGTTKGISFTTNIDDAEDYFNGVLLAIMLSKTKNQKEAVETFQKWAKVQESRLGVNLSQIVIDFESELKRYMDIKPNSFNDNLKSVRQVITMKASRLNKRLDDPVIYGKLEKFSNVDLNNLGIVSVDKINIPQEAEIKQGTDAGEIRISGAEIPISQIESRGFKA